MIRSFLLFSLAAATHLSANTDGGGSLWYRQPATEWVQALPVGNGSLGGMIFGGPARDRIQFNEQTLWTGDEIKMGNYQPFGDIYIECPDLSDATDYKRELSLGDAIHRTTFTVKGTRHTREIFSSHPDKVMIIRLTADRPASIHCTVRLTDMHKGAIRAANKTITATGSLENGLLYESRISAIADSGNIVQDGSNLKIDKADSVTLILAAATNFANSPEQAWRGEKPGPKLDRILSAGARKSYADLK
jgi:alpha-L-fucosidase 2